jgi:hypothetical protein
MNFGLWTLRPSASGKRRVLFNDLGQLHFRDSSNAGLYLKGCPDWVAVRLCHLSWASCSLLWTKPPLPSVQAAVRNISPSSGNMEATSRRLARRCNERGAHASSVRLRIERISSFSDAWSEGGQRRSSRADVECVEPVNRRTAQVAAQAGVDATRV